MIIYKITNLINNKIYVGKDSKNSPKYFGSGKLIKLAILKYGKENFKKEILEVCDTPEQLNESEMWWISYLQSQNSTIGYNLTVGGDGHRAGTRFSNETKLKISHSQTYSGYVDKYGDIEGPIRYYKKTSNQKLASALRYEKLEERQKYSRPGKLNGMYGKHHSDEAKAKIGESNKNRHPSDATRKLLHDNSSGCKNPNFRNGYKQSGANNGRAKHWIIFSPGNDATEVHGDLANQCIKLNISKNLLCRYINQIVPVTRIRKCTNELEYNRRINTLGWKLITCEQ